MWYIYTREYYAGIKRNEITSFKGVWMKLEAIILSKLKQEQKSKHHMFSFITGSSTLRTERRTAHTRACCRVGVEGRDSGRWGD